jgi:hypothetical protein
MSDSDVIFMKDSKPKLKSPDDKNENAVLIAQNGIFVFLIKYRSIR